MFDAYRANKALEGRLRPGDKLEVVGVDDITGDYWVLTGQELVVVSAGELKWRIDLDNVKGEVSTTPAGVEVRLRDAATGELNIAAFRRSNRLTDRLSALLDDASGASD